MAADGERSISGCSRARRKRKHFEVFTPGRGPRFVGPGRYFLCILRDYADLSPLLAAFVRAALTGWSSAPGNLPFRLVRHPGQHRVSRFGANPGGGCPGGRRQLSPPKSRSTVGSSLRALRGLYATNNFEANGTASSRSSAARCARAHETHRAADPERRVGVGPDKVSPSSVLETGWTS